MNFSSTMWTTDAPANDPALVENFFRFCDRVWTDEIGALHSISGSPERDWAELSSRAAWSRNITVQVRDVCNPNLRLFYA